MIESWNNAGLIIGAAGTNDSSYPIRFDVGRSEIARFSEDGRLGIGTTTPEELIDVDGAIRIGTTTSTNAGSLRWTGSDFEGYDGSDWVSLTSGGGVVGDFFEQGGNAFGSTAILGTTDAEGLNIITDSSTALSISASGEASFFNGLTILSGNLDLSGGDITDVGTITANSFIGDGSEMTALNASEITSGTLDNNRLSSSVAITSEDQQFTGRPDFSAGIRLGNTAVAQAGSLRWTGGDFEGYNGSEWVSLTQGGSASAGYANARLTTTFGSNINTSSPTVVQWNTQRSVDDPPFSHSTSANPGRINITEDGTYRIYANLSFTSTVVRANPKMQFRLNGATVLDGASASGYIRSGSGHNAASTNLVIIEELEAGDYIEVITQQEAASGSVTLIPSESTFIIETAVAGEAGGSGGSSGLEFTQSGNAFGSTAILGTTDAEGLNIITDSSTALSISASGEASFFNGLTILSGNLDLSGGDITDVGTITANSFIGDGSEMTALNASEITSGTLSDDRLSSNIARLDQAQTFTASQVFSDVTVTTISGDGLGLTSLDAGSISTGELADGRLSSNVAFLDGGQTFSTRITLDGGLTLGSTSTTQAGSLRWTGGDFEGFDGSDWVSLTQGGGLSGSGSTGEIAVFDSSGGLEGASGLAWDGSEVLDINVAQIISSTPTWAPNGRLDFLPTGGATGATFVVQEEGLISGRDLVFQLQTDGSSNWGMIESWDSAGLSIGAAGGSNNRIRFDVGRNEAARFTNNGRFGIGTTSPEELLDVDGAIRIGSTSSTNTGALRWTGSDFEGYDGTTWLSLTGTGSSDVRLKENITSLDNSILDGLSTVNTVNFSFKCEDESLSHLGLRCDEQVGVIAQELAGIFPELVYEDVNGYLRVRYDALNMYTLSAVSELARIIDSTGSINTKEVKTDGAIRVSKEGKLQNITGLSLMSGGASIVGGIDNNYGGLSPVGDVTGVDELQAGNLVLRGSEGGAALKIMQEDDAVFTIADDGALAITSSSTHAFGVRNSSGDSIFSIDSQRGLVYIGDMSATAETVLFVLAGRDDPSDPGGVEGAQYYNRALQRFRCYQDGRWQNCIGGGISEHLLLSSRSNAIIAATASPLDAASKLWVDLREAYEYQLQLDVRDMSLVDDAKVRCRLEYQDDESWKKLGKPAEFSEIGVIRSGWQEIAEQVEDIDDEVLVRLSCQMMSDDDGDGSEAELTLGAIRLQVR